MSDTKLRRFVEVLLEIARKNGKSTMLAGDGNTDLFIGTGGSEVCCASNDDRQAKYIWREIAGMRDRLDPKKAITSRNLVEIRNDRKNIIISRMSSKTQNKDGGNYTKTYLDEAHDIDEENGNSEIAEACWRGMSTKDDPLFITCTTQGFSRDGCFLDKKIAHAKAVIEGEKEDIHFLAFLYEQDCEQEIWQDESSWEKSNPSLRYGVKKCQNSVAMLTLLGLIKKHDCICFVKISTSNKTVRRRGFVLKTLCICKKNKALKIFAAVFVWVRLTVRKQRTLQI